MILHGRNWLRVSKFVGSRDRKQCELRYYSSENKRKKMESKLGLETSKDDPTRDEAL